MTQREFWGILKATGSKWNEHNAPRLGAALAYYALLSMAPLLVLIVYICGLVLTKSTVEDRLLGQVQALAGLSGAKTVKTLVDNAHHASGLAAGLIALGTLLFGASGVFVELRDSLNTIWDAPKTEFAWRNMIWQRVVSFGMVLGLGFLLLASLLASAALTVFEKFFAGLVPLHLAIFGEIANFLISLAALTILFALIFKLVPDVPIDWRDVATGAFATAILFTIGKALLGLYLGTAGVGSTYGAAGSLVALVVWVYYSAQIFFFGAVFTRIYADTFGSHAVQRQGKAVARTAAAGTGADHKHGIAY